MKWLLACFVVFFIVAPAMAGEDPYIAIVGNDCSPGFVNPFFGGTCPGLIFDDSFTYDGLPVYGVDGAALPFYHSLKHLQFMYDQNLFGVPVCSTGTAPTATQAPFSFQRFPLTPSPALGCEAFFAQGPAEQPEVCDVLGTGTIPPFTTRGNPNVVVRAGNTGFFEWWIRLPKKPSGEINLVFQCGVLKPNAFAFYNFDAIELCAAETGERIGPNCTRIEVDPGTNPVLSSALPRLTAKAYPGPFNDFTPFLLTAFRNPGSYTLPLDSKTGCMMNNGNAQALDGSVNTRILLKACMDKTVVVKLPVTGQCNATIDTEMDLEAGDIIQIHLEIPRANSVDIYCNAQSARLAGVGESPF